QPDPKDKMSQATALLVDVTGKKKEVAGLLKKIEANQTANKVKRTTLKEAGLEIIQYEQPLQPGKKEPERTFLCVANDQLMITDHEATIRGILKRLDGQAQDSLA